MAVLTKAGTAFDHAISRCRETPINQRLPNGDGKFITATGVGNDDLYFRLLIMLRIKSGMMRRVFKLRLTA